MRTGSPYAVTPGRVTTGAGEPYRVFTPYHRAWADHGWRGPIDAPRDADWLELAETADLPQTGAARRSHPPRGRRGGGATPVGRVPGSRLVVRRGPRPPWRRGHLADVGAPEVGRDPPAHDAGRPGPAAQHRRRDVPQGAGVAGVLRRRSRGPSRDCARLPASRVRADAVRRARRAARSVAGGPHRLPGRRRRAAPAAGDRVDAQPGADDRGELPGQGPASGVAARCSPLHDVARRRRPGLQPARVAVGCGQRHRCGAVLPGLQPDQPEPQVRRTGGVRPAVGAGAGRRRRSARAVDRRPRPGSATPLPIVDHAAERLEALARWEEIR